MRIISLLPSATEIVCALGLESSLVGVTHECDYPLDVKTLPKVTRNKIPVTATSAEIDNMVREQLQTEASLYSLDEDLFASLKPDLIITQSLCNVCAVAESEVRSAVCRLSTKAQVINLEPTTLTEVMESISQVAEAAGATTQSESLIESLTDRVESVRASSRNVEHRPSVVLLEWIDPLFTAGHWNPELVELAGGIDLFGKKGQPSVRIEWKDLLAADPEILVISCCGYDAERAKQDLPILESHPGWSSLRCVKSNRVYFMDGSSYFSRPGPRLVDSLELLQQCFFESR